MLLRKTLWFVAAGAALVYLAGLSLSDIFAPATGLDPSWTLGITEAHLLGLVFGRDIIFTYGPFGYLLNGVATPETFGSQVLARTCLVGAVGLAVVLSASSPMPAYRRLAFVAASAVAIGLTGGDPELLVTLLLLAALTLLHADSAKLPRFALCVGIVAGILSLTKFTAAVESAAAVSAVLGVPLLIGLRGGRPWFDRGFALATFIGAMLASSALPFAAIDRGLTCAVAACAVFIATAIAGVFFWERPRAIGAIPRSALAALGIALVSALVLASSPDYVSFVLGSLQTSLGYSAAMSTLGKSGDVTIAVLELVLVVFVGVYNRKSIGAGGIFALLVVSWLCFKEGYVRQDGHIFTFFASMCIVLAMSIRQARTSLGTALVSFAFAIAVFVYGIELSIVAPGQAIGPSLAPPDVAQTVGRFAHEWTQVPARGELQEALSPDAFPRPIRDRLATLPVDVEPLETDVVFANRFRWAPEPVFQSYGAYTRALDAANAKELERGEKRVLFNYLAIDQRYPMAESPAARRALLCEYAPDPAFGNASAATQNGTAYLVLRPQRGRCASLGEGASSRIGWQQIVPLRQTDGAHLVFVSLDIRYSLLGQIVKTLFKAPPIFLRLNAADGTKVTYRILSAVSGTKFLIEPAPATQAEYALLAVGLLPGRETSMELTVDWPWMFSPTIGVAFENVLLRPNVADDASRRKVSP